MSKIIIGIDPGNKESAICMYGMNAIVLFNEIVPNEVFLQKIQKIHSEGVVLSDSVGIPIYLEDIQAMGMAVGQEVFDTAKMIGRIQLFLEQNSISYKMVKRTEIKLHHCGSSRAKDANITLALVDRFDPSREFGKYGKGTAKNKGFFYGFKDDMWSAFAIALYGHDKESGLR